MSVCLSVASEKKMSVMKSTKRAHVSNKQDVSAQRRHRCTRGGWGGWEGGVTLLCFLPPWRSVKSVDVIISVDGDGFYFVLRDRLQISCNEQL